MVMQTIQIRLSDGLVKGIDSFVESGFYANRADVIRDAVRKMLFQKMAGIMPPSKETGEQIIRKAREELSKQPFNLDEINSLLK